MRNFNRYPAICLYTDNNMLHSLFCFQKQISCRMIGCGFLHVNTFTYSLLKGVFQLDRTANKLAVYGRTIFSFINGLPVATALISAYWKVTSSISSQLLPIDFEVMTCEMKRCLFSTTLHEYASKVPFVT